MCFSDDPQLIQSFNAETDSDKPVIGSIVNLRGGKQVRTTGVSALVGWDAIQKHADSVPNPNAIVRLHSTIDGILWVATVEPVTASVPETSANIPELAGV